MKAIKVLLADDHTVVRQGLHSLLDVERDVDVVGEAETGRQAVQLTRKLQPDVVVMDIAMPLLNGLEATRQILKDFPDSKVIILSAHNDDAYVEQVMKLGAAGFLLKQDSSHDLAMAIHGVLNGNKYFSPAIVKRRKDRNQMTQNREGTFQTKVNHLSSREIEVLQLIAEGEPNKQVAAELGVSFKTVDKHRQHLMSKLNIHDIAGLTRYAIAEGIIENDVRLTIS